MSIPTLAEAKASAIATEIAPFEEGITEYLEQPATISYLENTKITNKVIIRTFIDKAITEAGILALMESIEAGGWTDATVENQIILPAESLGSDRKPGKPSVVVTFKPAAAGG